MGYKVRIGEYILPLERLQFVARKTTTTAQTQPMIIHDNTDFSPPWKRIQHPLIFTLSKINIPDVPEKRRKITQKSMQKSMRKSKRKSKRKSSKQDDIVTNYVCYLIIFNNRIRVKMRNIIVQGERGIVQL